LSSRDGEKGIDVEGSGTAYFVETSLMNQVVDFTKRLPLASGFVEVTLRVGSRQKSPNI
jgi:hypothetical protein